jgi:hypothetical protein
MDAAIGAVMSETPSSAVTTAWAVAPSSSGDALDVMAVPAASAGSSDALPGTSEAQALDDYVPLDLLLRPRGLVDIDLPPDAPLYAASEITDWPGTVHDAARLSAFSAPGLDLVFDGDGEGTHLSADHPAFAVARAGASSIAELPDPLVELATLAAEPDAAATAPPDAPIHVDIVGGEIARVDLGALAPCAPELSWLATSDGGVHVGEAWTWSDVMGTYVFDHYV